VEEEPPRSRVYMSAQHLQLEFGRPRIWPGTLLGGGVGGGVALALRPT
jgi:hypothetical protein